MIVADWLIGGAAFVDREERERLRDEVAWLLIAFQRGRDPVALEPSRPLLELLEVAAPLPRATVHDLLAALLVGLAGGYRRLGDRLAAVGFPDARETTHDEADSLAQSAAIHRAQARRFDVTRS